MTGRCADVDENSNKKLKQNLFEFEPKNLDDMIQSITYTEPKLCHYDYDLKQAWFVHFAIKNNVTGEIIRKQFRGGINLLKTKEARIRAANALRTSIKKQLKGGWHPFEKTPTTAQNLNNLKFDAALDFAVEQCVVSKSTKKAYTLIVKYIKAASEKLGTKYLPVTDIKRQHIKLLLQEVKKTRKWSNSEYNKNVGYLSAVASWRNGDHRVQPCK